MHSLHSQTIVLIFSEKESVRAALVSNSNSVSSTPEKGRMTSESLFPVHMGFSSCRKSVTLRGSKDIGSLSRLNGDDFPAGSDSAHLSQKKISVARSVDTVDFEEIFKLDADGFNALSSLSRHLAMNIRVYY